MTFTGLMLGWAGGAAGVLLARTAWLVVHTARTTHSSDLFAEKLLEEILASYFGLETLLLAVLWPLIVPTLVLIGLLYGLSVVAVLLFHKPVYWLLRKVITWMK